MRPVLHDGCAAWSESELGSAVAAAATLLRERGARVLATVLDNTPAFVALDEAAGAGGFVHVPLPVWTR